MICPAVFPCNKTQYCAYIHRVKITFISSYLKEGIQFAS